MIIASVPHSGSRFVQQLIGCKFLHVYSGESLEEIRHHELIVVPLRHPLAVARSWKSRGKPVVSHHKHEAMCVMFRSLIDHVSPLDPVYLPIDSEHREAALEALGKRLGRVLTTDWAPVTDTGIARQRDTLSDYERLSVLELMTDPFFKRVGYTAPTRF